MVARRGLLSVILTDLSFAPLPGQGAPILSNIDGDVVLSTIDQFPAHRMNISASDMFAVKTIDPNILPCGCIITEEGLGEVARGYIYDPQGQINDSGHIIALTIPNQTDALRGDTTAPGWVAATGLDTIANRLASRSPPWTASVIDTGPSVLSTKPFLWFANDPNTSNADLNTFTKNDGVAAGWNVGAISQEAITSGDGSMSTIAFGVATHRMFGFTNNFYTYSYEMLQHAIYLATDGLNRPTSGMLQVFESGVAKYNGGPGSYYPGDVLSIAIINGSIQYQKNNVTFYYSSVAPAYPCHAGCSIYSANAAILGASLSTFVAPKDTYYAVAFENTPILDALTSLANRTYRHIRQKWVGGVPVQAMEIGLFGAAPTMTLKTADGESPSQTRARNPNTRLISPQVDYQWTTSEMYTIAAAIGGGNGDTQVDLSYLYNYLNGIPNELGDGVVHSAPAPRLSTNGPAYDLFPEYLPNDFPIERRVALNGKYYYVVKNVAAITAMKARGHWSGEVWGDASDSSIVYVDQSPDAQRAAVQRALYLSIVTKLKQHAQQHFTATLQVDGRGRITQAGDLINIQISRVGRGRAVGGTEQSFMEVDIKATPTVMSWTRKYRESDITDEVKVSSLGKLLGNDATALADTLRQSEAVRLIPDTKESDVYIGPIEQTINTIYPLDIPIDLPETMTKMVAVTIRVTAKPARHNIHLEQGAQMDGSHDHAVTVPPLTVQVFNNVPHTHTTFTPTHDHGGLTTTLGTTGNTSIDHSQSFATGTHSHKILAVNPYIDTGTPNGWGALKYDTATVSGTTVVTQVRLLAFTNQQAGGGHTHGEDAASYTVPPSVQTIAGVNRSLGSGATPFAFATSVFQHDTSGNFSANDNGGQFIGVTTAQQLVTHATDGGQLSGAHTHNLFPDVVETNLGSYFQIWIDSGDGQYIDRSPELGGPWQGRDALIKGNVIGIGTGAERFFQAPGKKVGIRVIAVNSQGNPTGIQNVQAVALLTYEKSAIASTIFAA